MLLATKESGPPATESVFPASWLLVIIILSAPPPISTAVPTESWKKLLLIIALPVLTEMAATCQEEKMESLIEISPGLLQSMLEVKSPQKEAPRMKALPPPPVDSPMKKERRVRNQAG
jgi:hypothetical protein